jgi:hypothetical protein
MLKKVQGSRNDGIDDIHDATERLLDPSLLISGYNIGEDSADNAVARLRSPGGHYILNGMQAKAEPWVPKLDIEAAYKALDWLDVQTKYITGVNEIMQGQSQKNVRSSGYASMLAQFASTELKRIAHTIEAQLEEAFTFTGQLFQENDGSTYTDQDTKRPFVLGQFPFDYRLEIYGHTGSPIATENNISLSMQLHDKGLMPAEILIDILPIPYKDQLKAYAKKMELQKAMAAASGQPMPNEPHKTGGKTKGHANLGEKQ